MKAQHFFALHPIFTHAEFAKAIQEDKGLSPKTIEASLRHYTQTGRIANIRKGLYVVIIPGQTSRNFTVDPFLLAGKLLDDTILGYHTALQYYGHTYSLWQHYVIITSHYLFPFQFRAQSFQTVKPPRKLIAKHQVLYGVNIEERQGISIRVTSLERTLVDLLDRPDLGGGWEEVWRSLEMISYFKLDKVLEYVRLRDNATLAAKVGFYLEQHQQALMITDDYLQALEKLIPKQPHYFDRAHRESQLIKRWNLMVPQNILEKNWEQVL